MGTMSKTLQKNTAKTAKKPAKPAPSKAKKPRAQSKSPQSKSVKTQQPLTLKALQTKITTLQASLKRNDTLTKKRVSALETTLAALETQSAKSNSAQKSALTRKFNQLTKKIEQMGEDARSSVNNDLKSALSGSTDSASLDSALSQAQMRITESEQAQAHALAKINHHLAAMASAVDTRFAAVETQIAELQAKQGHEGAGGEWQKETTMRIDVLEQDTATALGRVGDKMAEITQELGKQSESHTLSIREKVAEMAAQTQTDFEQYRTNIENRLSNVEAAYEETPITRRLEQTIAALSARIEGLEYDLALRPPAAVAPAQAEGYAPAEQTAGQPFEQSIDSLKPQLNLVRSAPAGENALSASTPDAFTPPQPADNTSQTPPNPYLQAAQTAPVDAPAPEALPEIEEQVTAAQETPAKDSHVPQEFDPEVFRPQTLAPAAPPPPLAPLAAVPMAEMQPAPMAELQPAPSTAMQPAPLAEMQQPPLGNTQLPYNPIDLQHDLPVPPMAAPGSLVPEVATYADPAYAEAEAGLMGDRIIDSNERKFSLPKIGGVSGRNLKVAGMAAGVAIVGLLAANTLLGSEQPDPAEEFAKTTAPAKAEATVKAEQPLADPIGEYADNRAPAPVSGEAATTLNSAAASGDSVAQFQLGLSYLEQGRTDEGVSLIRKSANQNQPAAQYRLAKLYEIGEGVSQDAQMARQLTERAATNGNRIAMHDLALYYAEGRGGVEADLKTASQWFEKAAQRGVVDSQFNLGVLFESGQGLPKNVTDAFVWYSIAAAQGDQFAKKRVEVLSTTLAASELEAAQLRVASFKPVKVDDKANGIFRNAPWNTTKTAQKSEDVSQVRQVQALLNDLGYDVGGADGAIGPRTRNAIIEFERVNGLPETGRVNTALISRLELAAGA